MGMRTDNPSSGSVSGVVGTDAALIDAVSRWYRFTKTAAQLSVAGLTNDIELFSLPSGGVIHRVLLKQSIPFIGGLIATYTLSVGITGVLAKYLAAFNVFQAAGVGVFGLGTVAGAESLGGATSIRLAAISTIANLDAATQGSVDVYAELSKVL